MGLVLRFSIGRSPRQSGPSALSRLYLRVQPFVANRWHDRAGQRWHPRLFAVTEDWFGLLDFSRGHFRAASLVRWASGLEEGGVFRAFPPGGGECLRSGGATMVGVS
jgi:hypothetical protein